ncbi:hypothetical protein EWM64_g5694 [Hericium alpestre]|uniref:Uncharacterized protein n=1 Tax=Hericium alpestre TaxID=135208 RepID=A0A4Y9ZU27_9AGAM|nr:hypothetical protein EWM64_g5694 [Hericium alpestre]
MPKWPLNRSVDWDPEVQGEVSSWGYWSDVALATAAAAQAATTSKEAAQQAAVMQAGPESDVHMQEEPHMPPLPMQVNSDDHAARPSKHKDKGKAPVPTQEQDFNRPAHTDPDHQLDLPLNITPPCCPDLSPHLPIAFIEEQMQQDRLVYDTHSQQLVVLDIKQICLQLGTHEGIIQGMVHLTTDVQRLSEQVSSIEPRWSPE